MEMDKVYNDLLNILDNTKVKKDEPLKKYTFTKTGGNADYFILPTTYQEVQDVIKYANQNNIEFTILGNGSNLIIKDGGIRGIVLNLTKLTDISLKDNKVIVQSGATIIDTSKFVLENHLTGLEFACGIPGTVGGAVYMNAGAYGGEISHVIESVLVLTRDGEILNLNKDDLELEYRNSSISREGYLVLEATFALQEGDYNKIKEQMDELTFLRESKQPLEYPSCGSVFKRPPGMFAGKLIQDSGLQGKQIGGVQVSTKHAGFMVNVGEGTASDYVKLIRYVQETVKSKFNVELETEVKIIGEELIS
ncbi:MULTISPECIES: UDP-N-acetylmuramate dehydrogenase [unclassified Bacillus (in: firmicutes)]|uniref:UDP-N-acetylmuramate dehydrogenase n=1 Tax=unclassified Bacillus (in: firmicutes) TaxID=185979 RepID=UPI00232D1A1E|nr:UDP-N-acetylmuramate dehydrogenase [Bacillus sp. BP-3]MDC2864452.1 UDP-N-acetylmuramate dehydrogenase [Bacillus sp. BP-3]